MGYEWMDEWMEFLQEEDGVGVIELVLILVVLHFVKGKPHAERGIV